MKSHHGELEREEIAVADPLTECDIDPEFSTGTADKPRPARSGRRMRMSVWNVMKAVFVLVCVFGLIAALGSGVGTSREAARRAQCSCNFCGILLAMHNYHSTYNALPPAYVADASGRPMHSWRVLILPFIDQSALYNLYDFSEPWDGPNNVKLLNSMPQNFACPSRFSNLTNLTSYVAVTGPGTIFPGATSTRLDDVTDGTSNTLMVVEIDNVKVPWTAPIDLDVRTMSFRINDPKRPAISSKHPGGAHLGFVNGRTRWAKDSVTATNLKALLTIGGGEGITGDQALDTN